MKEGDRVVITKAEDPFFCVGDKATLSHQDDKGEWWAVFDDRFWGDDNDSEFCLQKGYSEFEIIKEER